MVHGLVSEWDMKNEPLTHHKADHLSILVSSRPQLLHPCLTRALASSSHLRPSLFAQKSTFTLQPSYWPFPSLTIQQVMEKNVYRILEQDMLHNSGNTKDHCNQISTSTEISI